MVRRPVVLLLDEPLANIDPPLRAEMRVELKRLHDTDGTTMVHVTHDRLGALTIGDRVAVVRAGQLEQTGSPDDVYRRPANQFVATFIGSPPMNVLPLVHAGESVRAGPFTFPSRMTPGGDLLAGIRPDHLVLAEHGGGVDADVDLVEGTGDSIIAHLVSQSHRFVARFAADVGVRSGDRIQIHAPSDRWYLFDLSTGRTLRYGT